MDIPIELMAGKNFQDTIDLVKLYVAEGRGMQTERLAIQQANGDTPKRPQVFEEDEYIPEPNRREVLDRRKRATYSLGGMAIVGVIVLLATAASSTHAEQPPVEVVQEVSPYDKLQAEIDSLGQKRIAELKHQEELRTIRKQIEETTKSKIDSINADINGSKDRVIAVDGDVAKLKTQQVTLSTTVQDNE